MLSPANKGEHYKGAITNATNYRLEQELLGIPLWLLANEHEDQALECMRYIVTQFSDGLFVRHTHRQLWRAYQALSGKNALPTEGRLQQELMHLDCWDEDETSRGMITPGFLAELEDRGSCKAYLPLGPAVVMIRELGRDLLGLYRKRTVIHSLEILYSRTTSAWNTPEDERAISELYDTVGRAIRARPSNRRSAVVISDAFRQDLHAIEAQQQGGNKTKAALRIHGC